MRLARSFDCSIRAGNPFARHVPIEQSTSVHEADEAARRLTRGVARGEPTAVAEFYESWFDFTLRLARRASGRDESFGLDIVQDVMIKAARSMPAVDSTAEVERWLTRVVCNSVLDRFREERRRAAREGRVRPRSTEADNSEAMQWVRQQLNSLREDDAMLVRLRFAGAMTFKAVGEAMNITTDAARGRLRAAVGALRDRHVEGDGHEQ